MVECSVDDEFTAPCQKRQAIEQASKVPALVSHDSPSIPFMCLGHRLIIAL